MFWAHNHFHLSLSVTRLTTHDQWLKQPIFFCSELLTGTLECSLWSIANLFASSHQSSDNACLDVLWVVQLVMKVPVSVCWLTVDLNPDSQAISAQHQYRLCDFVWCFFLLHALMRDKFLVVK